MANPRLLYTMHRIHADNSTVPADGTITLPVVGITGMVPNLSPQVGMAVAITATGTNSPQCGLGAAGNRLFGKLMAVEPDGACSVQDDGYMYLPYNTGTPPTPNNSVTVDGTGKVQVAAAPNDTLCVGFGLDPEPLFTTTPALLAIVRV